MLPFKILSGASIIAAGDIVARDASVFAGYEKVGLVGALIVAVYVLWIADQKRQDKMTALIEEAIKVMTQVRDALHACEVFRSEKKG